MAESQAPYSYTPLQKQAIREAISEPRFTTYLKKAGNHEEYALAIYLYNSRLAKAFLYPLNIAEVTTRNAVDEVLVRRFGNNWHQNTNFRNHTLTQASLSTLDKAIIRAGNNAQRGQVIATLTFDFWSNLFRPDYSNFWRTEASAAFQNLPHGHGRKELQKLVKEINQFRNRVAHHEPIFDVNVNEVHSRIVKLISLRCNDTAAWMKHYSTLSTVIRTRPHSATQVKTSLLSRLDTNYLEVKASATIMDVMVALKGKKLSIVQVGDKGEFISAFTSLNITQYLSKAANELDGTIDLSEHTVGQLVDDDSANANWACIDDTAALAEAIAELQKPQVQILVGVNAETGKATGTIIRAHRRY